MSRNLESANRRFRRQLAEAAESLVAGLLVRQGWRLLGRNVRGTGFELDLIAKKSGTLIIVEVKARRQAMVSAFMAAGLLPRRKKQALARGAAFAAAAWPDNVETVRVDLAVVQMPRGGQVQIEYHAGVLQD